MGDVRRTSEGTRESRFSPEGAPAPILALLAAFLGGIAWTAKGSWLHAWAVFLSLFPAALWISSRRLGAVGADYLEREGIEALGPGALRNLARTDTIVTCKTGVLTDGPPKVVEFLNNVGEGREAEAYSYAAAAERGIQGPIAEAITAYCESRAAVRFEPGQVEFFPGEGVRAEVEGKRICLGTFAFVQRHGLDLRRLLRDPTSRPVASRVYLAVGERLYGVFYLESSARSSLAAVAERARAGGVELVLASSDSEQAANSVAVAYGIRRVEAGLTPEGKRSLVEKLRSEGHCVAVLGNGPSDIPALSAADVAIVDRPSLTSDGVVISPLLLESVLNARAYLARVRSIGILNVSIAVPAHLALGLGAWLGKVGPLTAAALSGTLAALLLLNNRWARGGRGGGTSARRKDVGEGDHWVDVEIAIAGPIDETLARSVETSLQSVPGVEWAVIELAPPRALVRCDRRYTTVTLLKNEIRAHGLRVEAAQGRGRMGHYADIDEDFKVVS